MKTIWELYIWSKTTKYRQELNTLTQDTNYVRDLRNEKKLDIRFKRSEDNSADIMTKNTQKELFEKHTKDIRTGSLTCWKEDVKSDPSVTLYGEAGKP